MGALLRQIWDAGVTLEVVGGNSLKVTGTLTPDLRCRIREHKPALFVELAAPHYRWRILRPDGTALESCFSPQITVADVLGRFPGCRALPLADSQTVST